MAIASVVRFEGTGNDWLLYKFKGDEFNTKSKLIVSTGQVAILVHNGQIEKIVEEGTYKMDTELLPFVKAFVKGWYGGSNPYPMEVYFINKRLKLDLLWGTADPIPVIDPVYNIKLSLRARGQMGIRLSNYQFFLQTLVGTLLKDNYIKFSVIQDYFRGIINQKTRKFLAGYIIDNKVTYFEINAHIDDIQTRLEESLREEVGQFGFDLVNLSIESINVPDDELEKLNDILLKKAEYEQLGDQVYRTTRGYDVLEAGAKNNSSTGSLFGVGLGMNMANQTTAAAGGIIPPQQNNANAASVNNTSAPQVTNKVSTFDCPRCGKDINYGSKFCPECGIALVYTCPKCGNTVDPGHKFCDNCGDRLYKDGGEE